ncbi:hypothetical protein LTR22_013781 [Elasticomyces elasticus]|nr:hypothetical protein LTR22_013781 [Elasticomyces elasticus]KAK4917630.1 hypothetical protein LTR49_014452 [Elasticomyces elasticus]KAK5752017.1 hypothetical protein LTS12_017867 [Elasticomyces elasticus]
MTVLSTHPHTVDVVFHPEHNKDVDTLVNAVAKAAHVNASGLSGSKGKERYLEAVAQIDEVQSIQEVRANKLFNNIARNILMGHGAVDGLNDVAVGAAKLRGQGQIVAVADTGVDSSHPAFSGGRILATFPLGRAGLTDDPEGHGTHVCGSVLGNADTADGLTIQGTAPEARLVMQSVGDAEGGLGGIPPNLGALFEQAYGQGARVHSNSWGDIVPAKGYGQSAREIDIFVDKNPDMVILFAAGNDGVDINRDGAVDLRQIGSQAAAKNCITLGASESFRPDLTLKYGYERFVTDSGQLKFGTNPIRFDRLANNPEGMAAFSSRGPSQERHIKPDVVAPGTGILSARSSQVHGTLPFGDSADPAWMYDAGTSMATPLVSGCAAVIRQALLLNPPNGATGSPYSPSAALVKAVLINGAVELKGQYQPSEAGLAPDYSSGWGRVHLNESVLTTTASDSAGCHEGAALDDGGSFAFTVPVTQTRAMLKVTLVWTDWPGPKLQNDLELTVSLGAQSRAGNTGLNRTNNVEQVVWTDIPQGRASVSTAARNLTHGPQSYAVAWKVSS